MQLLGMHRAAPIPRLADRVPVGTELPDGLQALIDKAMAKSPGERFQTAIEHGGRDRRGRGWQARAAGHRGESADQRTGLRRPCWIYHRGRLSSRRRQVAVLAGPDQHADPRRRRDRDGGLLHPAPQDRARHGRGAGWCTMPSRPRAARGIKAARGARSSRPRRRSRPARRDRRRGATSARRRRSARRGSDLGSAGATSARRGATSVGGERLGRRRGGAISVRRCSDSARRARRAAISARRARWAAIRLGGQRPGPGGQRHRLRRRIRRRWTPTRTRPTIPRRPRPPAPDDDDEAADAPADHRRGRQAAAAGAGADREQPPRRRPAHPGRQERARARRACAASRARRRTAPAPTSRSSWATSTSTRSGGRSRSSDVPDGDPAKRRVPRNPDAQPQRRPHARKLPDEVQGREFPPGVVGRRRPST